MNPRVQNFYNVELNKIINNLIDEYDSLLNKSYECDIFDDKMCALVVLIDKLRTMELGCLEK